MVFILTFVYCFLIAFCFGAVRLLDSKRKNFLLFDSKKKEFLLFLAMYLFALLCISCMSFIFTKVRAGGNWHLHVHTLRDLLLMLIYYGPPSFLCAYLLYPFKNIKRNRILIWALGGLSLVVLGGSFILQIFVLFSNM